VTDPRTVDVLALEREFPSIRWRDPLRIPVRQGPPRFGCRICIGMRGLRGNEAEQLPATRAEWERHFAIAHVRANASAIGRPLSNHAFIAAVIERLDRSGRLLYLHSSDRAGPDAVVMTWGVYGRLLALVPESDAITRLVMAHDNITGS
jgi:hypothetical protein